MHLQLPLDSCKFQEVKARSHCKELLQRVIVRNHARTHCKQSLQGVIAISSLQRVIARSYCKESLQEVIRAIASCKKPSAWSQAQVASARSFVQVASARGQVRGTKCKEPSAWSQVFKCKKVKCKLQSQVQVAILAMTSCNGSLRNDSLQ